MHVRKSDPAGRGSCLFTMKAEEILNAMAPTFDLHMLPRDKCEAMWTVGSSSKKRGASLGCARRPICGE